MEPVLSGSNAGQRKVSIKSLFITTPKESVKARRLVVLVKLIRRFGDMWQES